MTTILLGIGLGATTFLTLTPDTAGAKRIAALALIHLVFGIVTSSLIVSLVLK